MSPFAEELQGSWHIEPTANVKAFVAVRQAQERQSVARRVVDAAAPKTSQQADNEGLAVGMACTYRWSDEPEGLVEPCFNDIDAEPWLDD